MSDQPEPVSWVPTYPRIRRLDEVIARGERVACALMFLAMGLMVFASVIPEVFGRRQKWSDVVVLFGVVLIGVYTRTIKDGEQRPKLPIALGVAAAVTAALAGAVWLYVREYPGGFIWAQKIAMVLMIWVAMVGASIATYDRSHLALEMGEKLWPEKILKYVKTLAHGVTTGFCVIAFIVSVQLVLTQQEEGDPISPAVEWMPNWVAFLVMPYAFAMMGIRFLAQAQTTATDTAAPPEERMPS
jgi:TRAP-type C4-dicarboxylate transport system permease small subunit